MKPPKKCPNAALVAAGNKTGVLWMKKKEMAAIYKTFNGKPLLKKKPKQNNITMYL